MLYVFRKTLYLKLKFVHTFSTKTWPKREWITYMEKKLNIRQDRHYLEVERDCLITTTPASYIIAGIIHRTYADLI